MGKELLAGLLGQAGGTVEVDETYVGGKPRKGTGPHKRGRGTKKTPVVALVERGGRVRSRPVKRIDGATLKSAITNTDIERICMCRASVEVSILILGGIGVGLCSQSLLRSGAK
jgi:hypothetical protein